MKYNGFTRIRSEKSWEVSKEVKCSVFKCLSSLWLIGFMVFSLGVAKSGDEFNLTFYLVKMSPFCPAPVTSQHLRASQQS